MSVSVVLQNAYETVGEGPHWDSATQTLYSVDIMKGCIHALEYKTNSHSVRHISDCCSLIVPRKTGGFVLALGRKFAVIDNWDGPINIIAEITDARGEDRFNDGKCDSDGRLWAGTLGKEPIPAQVDPQKGVLYSLNSSGKLTPQLDKIDISNGLAWTSDDKTFYFIDSIPKCIYGFAFDKVNGTISNKGLIYQHGDNEGVLDGMAIDDDGMLWVACFFGSRVIKVDPKQGKVLQTIMFPASRITSCCFGGPNMNELFVTSARKDDEPLSGSLFKVTGLGVSGPEHNMFTG